MMAKVQKPNNSEYYTPSSGPFGISLIACLQNRLLWVFLQQNRNGVLTFHIPTAMTMKSSRMLWYVACMSWKFTDVSEEPVSIPKVELPCLAYCSTIQMEALCSSETSLNFYITTWRHIPEAGTLRNNFLLQNYRTAPGIQKEKSISLLRTAKILVHVDSQLLESLKKM
jgi:hypothetical protein